MNKKINICINGSKLQNCKRVKCFKYLGLMVDRKLKCINHIVIIEMRSGNNFVNGFTLNEINQMIEIIATD